MDDPTIGIGPPTPAEDLDQVIDHWSGFGHFLLSMPMRYATMPINAVGSEKTSGTVRHEWLFRPPGGMCPTRVFDALQGDPDLANVELQIVEAALGWASLNKPVAINVSPAAMATVGFCPRLMRIIDAAGLSGRQTWCEITGGWPVPDVVESRSTIACLSAVGVHIALGEITSEERIHQWVKVYGAPDICKIDRSVLKDKQEALPLLVATAMSYGAEVVVEGVEEESQLAFVREKTDASYWQGFLAGSPKPVI